MGRGQVPRISGNNVESVGRNITTPPGFAFQAKALGELVRFRQMKKVENSVVIDGRRAVVTRSARATHWCRDFFYTPIKIISNHTVETCRDYTTTMEYGNMDMNIQFGALETLKPLKC